MRYGIFCKLYVLFCSQGSISEQMKMRINQRWPSSRDLILKIAVIFVQSVKKKIILYGARSVITVFTIVNHWSLPIRPLFIKWNMQVHFFTWSKLKQKIAQSTAATRIEYSIENQYIHVVRMVGKLLPCGHWMLKPGNYVEIHLQPVLLDRISSHPSLALYWSSYSTLLCCLNTYVQQKF
jgi:hypothetical protein